MNHSICSLEERLSGKSFIDFTNLLTHPEDKFYIVEKYISDMAFRRELLAYLHNNPIFHARFIAYFKDYIPKLKEGR